MRANLRLRAHQLGDGESVLEQTAQHRPQGVNLARQREGLLHLAQNLRFPDHQRVQLV